jgi:hypothetical protein
MKIPESWNRATSFLKITILLVIYQWIAIQNVWEILTNLNECTDDTMKNIPNKDFCQVNHT